ncbi:DEAD/DEAH box helicase family protein [Neorhodopirellula pilleata]|nr:DEAD/DEAH box helicase family protein [Neorhodopirellula pilleata]
MRISNQYGCFKSNCESSLPSFHTNNFYNKRGVFVPTDGAYLSELKTGANHHDCDNAHIVVGNIQQFAGENNRWYEQFDPDYFRMILVDEGHHNVADTWQRLFEYFGSAKLSHSCHAESVKQTIPTRQSDIAN